MPRKKLSKKQAKVWDRLKNGIQSPSPQKDSTYEDFIIKTLAESIRKEVDAEIIKTLINQLNVIK